VTAAERAADGRPEAPDGPAPDRLVDAWLTVIGRAGWRGATVEAAAGEAGVPAAVLMAALGDGTDAVEALLDRAVRAAARAAAAEGSVRDRLFAGVMAAFDALQPHRAALEALLAARDAALGVRAVARLAPGLRRLAAAAGVDTTGFAGSLRLAGLSTVVLRAFRVWRRDESPDLGRTMAELDRLLAEAERVATSGLSPEAFGLVLPWRRG